MKIKVRSIVKKGVYGMLLLTMACAEYRNIPTFKLIEEEELATQHKKVKYLTGKLYPMSVPKSFYGGVLILYYNDSTKIATTSDFDGNFSFYDVKKKLITKKSYLYAGIVGYASKKIRFRSLKKPLHITLQKDSIKGLSKKEYLTLLAKNIPID